MSTATVRGHLDLLLLAILADGALHGYAVIEALKNRSNGLFDLPEGTVYPALHRLERTRLIESSWETAAGRRRRSYDITQRGRTALSRQRGEWQAFTRAVGAVVGQ
jgi:PadR family transcriptional regulator, regulatory protein PadR